MSEKQQKGKRDPVHVEQAKGLDPDAFANKIADGMIAEINRQRKAKGKPPLEEK